VTEKEREYIEYRITRARETLNEAELMLSNAYLHGAVNRLYYACFYAVSALLLTRGQSSSKHAGVKAIFDREWVNSGQIPLESGRFYRRLFEWRQRGDYDDLTAFDVGEVAKALEDAKLFVECIADRIRAADGELSPGS
jgi:uncharacterized protein (UPF0332 family)